MGIIAKAVRNMVERITGGSYTFIAPLPLSDRRVIGQTAAYYSVSFLGCMLAKSTALASLPVHVFQKKDGVRKKIEHPLTRILSRRWNAYMTAFEGWNWLIQRRDVFGQAAVRVTYNLRGEPVAFYPINAPIELMYDGATKQTFYEVKNGDSFTPAGRYKSYEILVFKTYVSTDCGVTGASLAKLAAENVGLSIDLEKFYSRLLNNGNHFPGYLETDSDLTNDEKKEIAESLKSTSGIQPAGTIRIFDKGLKYKQNPMTMGDISLAEQQTWVLQQCCRILRVPPSSVYENSRSTYSNVETMELQFARTTLTNEATAIEQVLQVIIDAMASRFPDCYVKFDLNGYMRGAYKERMEGYRIGVYAGFFTRAEIREWEELPPIEGLEEPLQPTAYYPVRDGEPIDWKTGKPANSILPIRADMEARVLQRFKENGDNEKTRDFAATVLLPLAKAYAIAGIDYDLEAEIERLAHE